MAQVVSGDVAAINANLFLLRAQLSIAVQTVTDPNQKTQLQHILSSVKIYLDSAK